MRRFNRLIAGFLVIGIVIIVLFTAYACSRGESSNKAYRIDVNRILSAVNSGVPPDEIELSPYQYVHSLGWIGGDEDAGEIRKFFDGEGMLNNDEYIIKPIYQGQKLAGYVRLSYAVPSNEPSLIVLVDVILLILLASVTGLMLYIRSQIIKPFHKIEGLPYELSRGHLKQGIKENKSRFFGKFIWGLDLLRETLEAQKQANLRLEKERQTLIASLSHELKTPVAAIKLYASALSGGLYDSEQKRIDAARMIEQQSEQIEGLITHIITTSVTLLQEVKITNGEFYLRDWMKRVVQNYEERLAILKIQFHIGEYQDKLLLGDRDKLLEVMDNLLENAIKYGDGEAIHISFREEDFRQLVIIENTGTPIPAAELSHIFTSFWRGSNAAGKQGNGLGLYICRQLLHKMDGEIFAETTDTGMRFVIVLRY